jgi:hypothetical protein
MNTDEKKSALNWLMSEYGYKYSKELAGMASCVQAYGDYVQSFESHVAQAALKDILKELQEITGMSPQVGYIIKLRHIKALLKREVKQ